MNYELFCQILNDNLIFEFTDSVSIELRDDYQQDWYSQFNEDRYWTEFKNLSPEQQVIAWMHEHFHECSFDTHNFQLKAQNQ